jgi:ATP-dependent protease HslVU (ClpYQ) peptidase subunit
MTTLIGIQGDGFGLLAADSMMVSGSKPYVSDGMCKIRHVGGVWIGFAGDGLAIDMVSGWKPNTHTWHDLAMSLKDHFTSKSYTHADDAWDALVLVDGVVVEIGADYSWMRDDDRIYGCGSGGDYAVGVLASMKSPWANAEKAIRAAKAALKVSGRYDINTGGDDQIVVQEEQDADG